MQSGDRLSAVRAAPLSGWPAGNPTPPGRRSRRSS